MFTKHFWASTLERALKTFAQAVLGTGIADAGGLLDISWEAVGSVGLLAALISVLTSLTSSNVGTNRNDPSVV